MKALLVSASIVLAALPASAQNTFVVDPPDAFTGFTSLGEWNTDGDAEGWTTNELPPTVAGGFLTGTTSGGDTQLVRNPFPAAYPLGNPNVVTVEVRFKRPATDATIFQLFWNDNAGGFAAARSTTVPAASIPADGAFHTVRIRLGNTVTGSLKGLRIDASQANSAALEFDYVRLRISSTAGVVDPPQLLNLYTSLGEWKNGDPVGWTGVNINGLTVGQGWLSGLTAGNDPQLVLNGLALDSTTGDFPIVEIRFRKETAETSRIDLFWADAAGGFAAARKSTVNAGSWPADGQFHVFQASIGDLLNGTVTGFRFDPVSDLTDSKAIAIDYIRIGRIAPDRDLDGLADEVENNDDMFVSPRQTGTDPDDFDSDDDTFSDGLEVSFGTDPNNEFEFPTPALTGYTLAPAVYVRNVAIAENAPVVANGTPTGFTVNPALPSGLLLNPGTGILTGTPDTVTASAPYTITASFSGGLTRDFALTLEVRNPGILRYGVNPATYNVNAPITANNPVLVGPAPASFAVAPALPDGLFLDTGTGSITGTPVTITPTASYTVTATYTGYPSASLPVSIRIKAVPVFVGTDNAPVGMFTSLGEWETGLDGWGFTNGNGAAAGGILTYNATALDPQMTRGGLAYDPAGGTLLELRFRQSDTALVEIFWGDINGGAAASRRTEIPSGVIIGDGQFHTYQISFADVFEGNLTLLRVDPGVVGGRTVEFDYIRIGTPGLPQPIAITNFVYDPLFREVTLTWTSSSGRTYRIEATDSFLAPWETVATGLAGDPGTTNYIDDSLPFGATRRYYRVRRE